MQTIIAYVTNDPLTLLTLLAVRTAHVAGLSGERPAQYDKVLANQQTNARNALEDLETGFRMTMAWRECCRTRRS
jgi:hypothetical protein